MHKDWIPNYIPPENNYINTDHIERETSLYDYVNYGYEGLGEIYSSADLPKDLYEFIDSQLERFKVPKPIPKLIESAAWDATVALNNWDPYAFFMGHTDVIVTEDWQVNTFELMNDDNRPMEIEPENIETFKLIPNNDEFFFRYAIDNPGLHVLADSMKSDSGELLFDGMYAADIIEQGIKGEDIHDDDAFQRASEPEKKWLIEHSPRMVTVPHIDTSFKYLKLEFWEPTDHPGEQHSGKWVKCNEPNLYAYRALKKGAEYKTKGNINPLDIVEFRERFEAEDFNARSYSTRLDYYRLISWATIVWMFSPMARKFRKESFNIYNACYEDGGGECMMYCGTVYSKKYYNKVPRPPRSCYICGLASWCVDITMIDGTIRSLCEKHVNGNIPAKAPINCGTRACRHVECPHHIYHGRKDAKALVYRDVGVINQRIRQNRNLLKANDQMQMQLLN